VTTTAIAYYFIKHLYITYAHNFKGFLFVFLFFKHQYTIYMLPYSISSKAEFYSEHSHSFLHVLQDVDIQS